MKTEIKTIEGIIQDTIESLETEQEKEQFVEQLADQTIPFIQSLANQKQFDRWSQDLIDHLFDKLLPEHENITYTWHEIKRAVRSIYRRD